MGFAIRNMEELKSCAVIKREHVLDTCNAKGRRESASNGRATASQEAEPKPIASLVAPHSLFCHNNHQPRTNTARTDEQHSQQHPSPRTNNFQSHRTNRSAHHYFHPAIGPSRNRLQAQLHRPYRIHATVAVLRNGHVIGKSNQ
jgi:hypothetical protein